ncbi:transcription antitermination factor NusB [Schaalia sp. Marseille-Q2122]|uniref:transcription antitermination factor NusB n=1 Tax=Schaalia sp. Marseille-Q2122 TaxID=2736604 RepID=UPI0020CA3A90|nr:transcription antitermination factor NusB [Schaalia sp. Marseille-Q2122]
MTKHQFTSRTKARKRAADVVFEADQRGMGSNPEVLRDLLRERKVITAALTPLPEYSIRVIEGVAQELRRIDTLIDDHADVAGLDRIPAVDLAVMRVAVWEMLANQEDVPAVIAIDEAISIVKSISTDASPNFVNAVLDAIRKEINSPAWKRSRVHDDDVYDAESGAAEVGDEDYEGDSASEGFAANDAEELSFEDFVAGVAEPEPMVDAVPVASPEAVVTSEEDLSEDEAAELEELPSHEDEDVAEDEDEAKETAGVESESVAPEGKRYPTLADITAADLAELDELLDEY